MAPSNFHPGFIVDRSNLTRVTSPPKLKYRRFPSYLFCTLLLLPFHLLPSPVHPTGFSFCMFPGFLAIFTLLWSNNNKDESEMDFCRPLLSGLSVAPVQPVRLVKSGVAKHVFCCLCLVSPDHLSVLWLKLGLCGSSRSVVL